VPTCVLAHVGQRVNRKDGARIHRHRFAHRTPPAALAASAAGDTSHITDGLLSRARLCPPLLHTVFSARHFPSASKTEGGRNDNGGTTLYQQAATLAPLPSLGDGRHVEGSYRYPQAARRPSRRRGATRRNAPASAARTTCACLSRCTSCGAIATYKITLPHLCCHFAPSTTLRPSCLPRTRSTFCLALACRISAALSPSRKQRTRLLPTGALRRACHLLTLKQTLTSRNNMISCACNLTLDQTITCLSSPRRYRHSPLVCLATDAFSWRAARMVVNRQPNAVSECNKLFYNLDDVTSPQRR